MYPPQPPQPDPLDPGLQPDPAEGMVSPDEMGIQQEEQAPPEEPPTVDETDEGRIILELTRTYDQLEDAPRLTNVKKWRKHINYWNSIQYGAWDTMDQIWKSPDQIADEDPTADLDPALYAKVVNVYKAHGQILIGALTSGVPTIRFFPKDADDEDDVTAAKAYSKVAELVQKQNKARLLLMKALYLLYNCGFVACYNENKTDYRFGYYETPEYSDVPVNRRATYCPSCGMDQGSETLPQGPSAPPQAIQCQNCGYQGVPEVEEQPDVETQQTGQKKNPKSRECLEVYGPLNVKIPLYAKSGQATPYVCLEDEHPVELLREIYPEYAAKIQAHAYTDNYEEQARIPATYGADEPSNLCTVQRWWFRPWALNLWNRDEEIVKGLKAQFEDGFYAVVINKSLIVEVLPDDLEKHWTFVEDPIAETLHAEPLGATMIPLQDIENELDNLTLETIEFGLPEVFADPKVLDFKAYQSQELRPGQVSPANAPSGRSLGEGFHEVKATTLSREVDMFAERMNSRQQFVQGTYPSIYGGVQEGSGGTAREYEMSKASALQRLSTIWLVLQDFWAATLDKSVRSFVKNMKADEQFVKTSGANFVNVWIKQIEVTGEVGEITPEIAEPFPVSWTQKRDVLLNLIQMQNEDVAAVIRHPENASLVASYIGLPDLYIPGDDSRNKQLAEISQLIVTEPMLAAPPMMGPVPPMGGETGNPQAPPLPPMGPEPPGPTPPPQGQSSKPLPSAPIGQAPPMMGAPGLPPMQSTVQVDPDLDDHFVECEVCKAWLRSEVGQDAKKNNPAGYMNVMIHMKEHNFFVQQAMVQQQQDEMALKSKGKESKGGNDNFTGDGQ